MLVNTYLLKQRKFCKIVTNKYFFFYLNLFFKLLFSIKMNFKKYYFWNYIKKNAI